MEEKDDIFRFEDFLNGDKIEDLARMKQSLIQEGIFEEEEFIEDSISPYFDKESDISDSEGFYELYRDRSEEFVCDIAIEGASQKDTEVRLIVESDDWTLMFSGEIRNGKCIIPIKKLSLFSEGQTGCIKLEVNADGNLFIPWEDRFVVNAAKKVTVSMNESLAREKVRVSVDKKRR